MTDPVVPPVVIPSLVGLDAELVGHVQNKAWDTSDPLKLAHAAIKASHEAQKFVGLPPERLAKIPTDKADEAGWKALWGKLGAPIDAAGYDLTGVTDPAIADAIRASAAANFLPKDAATAVGAAVVKAIAAKETAAGVEKASKLVTERAALKTSWGTNMDANMVVAKAGAAKLGITPEEVAALEQVAGYAKTMEAFRKVGALSGEDKFITGGGGDGKVMTREQAKARRVELMADSDWAKRYLGGGAAEKRQMADLIAVEVGGA